MKQITLVMLALAATVLVSANRPKEEVEQRLRALHQERIKVWREVLDVLESQKTNWLVTRDEITRAHVQHLRAQLDAAETTEQRIVVHEKIVELMKEFEDMAEQIVQRAHADRTVYLKAKADRLKAEIDLELTRSGK